MRTVFNAAVQAVVAVGIIVGAVLLANQLLESKPESERGPRGPGNAILVDSVEVEMGTQTVVIEASGTVGPAREITLFPRVQGEVLAVHAELVPGGRLPAGAEVVSIDDADYQVALRQARAVRDQADANRRLEEASRDTARAEYERFRDELGDVDTDLVLRQPQADVAEAAYRSANAQLSRARLDLTRTSVAAPFDAVVLRRSVDVGSRVTQNSEIARLAGTDAFWVDVAIPVDHLRWITLPDPDGTPGSSVRVFHRAAWGPEAYREGHVVRLQPDLEEGGRMARLLVAVEDPLSLSPEHASRPRLFLGAWVEVEVQGTEVDDVIALDRALVRAGSHAWVVGEGDVLEIRDLQIAFSTRDTVYVIDGLAPDDRVVSSGISAPVDGMQLRTGPPPGMGPPGEGASSRPHRGQGPPGQGERRRGREAPR